MKLLQPKRPLRPRRKGRKRIPVKGLTGQEVKVSTTFYNNLSSKFTRCKKLFLLQIKPGNPVARVPE